MHSIDMKWTTKVLHIIFLFNFFQHFMSTTYLSLCMWAESTLFGSCATKNRTYEILALETMYVCVCIENHIHMYTRDWMRYWIDAQHENSTKSSKTFFFTVFIIPIVNLLCEYIVHAIYCAVCCECGIPLKIVDFFRWFGHRIENWHDMACHIWIKKNHSAIFWCWHSYFTEYSLLFKNHNKCKHCSYSSKFCIWFIRKRQGSNLYNIFGFVFASILLSSH